MIKKDDPDKGHICLMCGSTITGIHKSGHWSAIDGGIGVWFNGNCGNCDIDYRLDVFNGVQGLWRILAPDKTALTETVKLEELELLNKKFLRYKVVGKKWRIFLSKCRTTDELWRYKRDDGETALAIVREGTPIAEFSALGSL